MLAQEGEWDEVAGVIHSFQQMTAAIKFCPRPVVVAPFGMALGGGGGDLPAPERAASPRGNVHWPGGSGRGVDSCRRRTKEMLLARR